MIVWVSKNVTVSVGRETGVEREAQPSAYSLAASGTTKQASKGSRCTGLVPVRAQPAGGCAIASSGSPGRNMVRSAWARSTSQPPTEAFGLAVQGPG